MEIEASTQQEMTKKLWQVLRAVFYMIRKSISKSKFMIDLQLLFKRGNKLATKAITNLLLLHHHHHHLSSAFSCRSSDAVLSFISPREYEFSCSNSPAGGTFYPLRLHKRHHHQLHLHHLAKSSKLYSDVSTVSAVHKMLEMLNNEAAAGVEASPLTALPGFGKSPLVRQLRITDSPFPLKDDGDSQVDKAAEEFIKRFYKDLKQQKISAVDSPYHGMWGR